MSARPILFYSPSCNHCINLWNELKQKNILDSITKINVNNTNNIPNNIKSVPSLLVQNRPPIEGNGISLYFNNNTASRPSDNTPSDNSDNNSTLKTKEGIEDYMPSEMSARWSDQYSYIDNNNPIEHSYTFLDNSNNTVVEPTNQLNNKNNKQDEMESRLENLKKMRTDELNVGR